MAADLDMDASGGEGWGDDAELQLDEGKVSHFEESGHIADAAALRTLFNLSVSQMASWTPRKD